jgi:hypothetical protein
VRGEEAKSWRERRDCHTRESLGEQRRGVGTPAGGAADGAAEVSTQRLAVSGLKSRNTNMEDTAELLAVSHSGRSELHGAAPGMMGMVGG